MHADIVITTRTGATVATALVPTSSGDLGLEIRQHDQLGTHDDVVLIVIPAPTEISGINRADRYRRALDFLERYAQLVADARDAWARKAANEGVVFVESRRSVADPELAKGDFYAGMPDVGQLIHDAAVAQEQFGDDELERFAAGLERNTARELDVQYAEDVPNAEPSDPAETSGPLGGA